MASRPTHRTSSNRSAGSGPSSGRSSTPLPTVGRVFFAAHRRMERPDDPLLSGWHAVNRLREWRGDTHWAIVAAAGLDGTEASIVHNAWLGYERDWLARSRGAVPTRSLRPGRRSRRRGSPPATR